MLKLHQLTVHGIHKPMNSTEGITNLYYKAYLMRLTYRFNERPDVFKIWQGFRCAQ